MKFHFFATCMVASTLASSLPDDLWNLVIDRALLQGTPFHALGMVCRHFHAQSIISRVIQLYPTAAGLKSYWKRAGIWGASRTNNSQLLSDVEGAKGVFAGILPVHRSNLLVSLPTTGQLRITVVDKAAQLYGSALCTQPDGNLDAQIVDWIDASVDDMPFSIDALLDYLSTLQLHSKSRVHVAFYPKLVDALVERNRGLYPDIPVFSPPMDTWINGVEVVLTQMQWMQASSFLDPDLFYPM